jgi:hypothetical protein
MPDYKPQAPGPTDKVQKNQKKCASGIHRNSALFRCSRMMLSRTGKFSNEARITYRKECLPAWSVTAVAFVSYKERKNESRKLEMRFIQRTVTEVA